MFATVVLQHHHITLLADLQITLEPAKAHFFALKNLNVKKPLKIKTCRFCVLVSMKPQIQNQNQFLWLEVPPQMIKFQWKERDILISFHY